MDEYKKEWIKVVLSIAFILSLVLILILAINSCCNRVEREVEDYREAKATTYYTVMVDGTTYYHCNNLTKSITGKTLTFECDGVRYQFTDNFAYKQEEEK